LRADLAAGILGTMHVDVKIARFVLAYWLSVNFAPSGATKVIFAGLGEGTITGPLVPAAPS
jgi:hypothetical protein